MNSIYIYRNSAVEYLFKNFDAEYSLYGDMSIVKTNRDILIMNFLPYTFCKSSILEFVNNYKKMVEYISNQYLNNQIYVITLYNYFYKSNIIGDNDVDNTINEFNDYLYNSEKVKVIDINEFYQNYGIKETFDLKYYYLYNAIINPKLANEFETFIKNKLKTFNTITRKKCLVIDLDNTLWGGILGEDGIANLKISGSYPGNCYNDFQKLILQLKTEGILLCLSSKNNYDDVKECFSKRDDLILSLDDFIIKKINWNNKRDAIIEISKELNIGLDSIVFIDDSPIERELVKSIKEITVLGFPQEPYLMCDYFSKEFNKCFGTYTIVNEDVQKNEQYLSKLKSDNYKQQFNNEEDFIKNLNIKIFYNEMNEYNIDRISQLINKTNQFNLTTQRYTKEDMTGMRNSYICCIKVIDKFGDLGITGVSIIKIIDDTADIDSFLLSCRILGRGIENQFLKLIINKLKEKGITKIKSKYIKSNKNSQTEYFYENNNFNITSKNEEEKCYEYIVTNFLKLDNKYVVEETNGK